MSDVRSVNVTATGAINIDRMRIMSIQFAPVATAGSIVVRDGGVGGTVVLTLDVGSGSNTNVLIPGCGLLVKAPHVTLTTVVSATFFHG